MSNTLKKCNELSFAAVIGQDKNKQRLLKALPEPGHAYIFTGPQGVGRTYMARNFAAALLCSEPDAAGACGKCPSCRYMQQQVHPDFTQLQLAEKEKVIPVDFVRRQVSGELFIQPRLGRRKVYLIDADHLNEQGQNALLKSLEEPPSYAVFLLTALGAGHLLPTTVSRSVILPDARRGPHDIQQLLLDNSLAQEDAALFYARFSQGLPGKAIGLAASDWFYDLRQETVTFFLGLARRSRADLLTAGYKFLEANRQYLDQMLEIMGSLIRDLLVLARGGAEKNIINEDCLDKLHQNLAGYPDKNSLAGRLGQAYAAVLAAQRGVILNASFEVLACNYLLVLRKELSYA